MILKLIHKRPYGRDLFYGNDEFTQTFLGIMRPPSLKSCSISLRQLRVLMSLGFEVDIDEAIDIFEF
jgi:hypothetical protein